MNIQQIKIKLFNKRNQRKCNKNNVEVTILQEIPLNKTDLKISSRYFYKSHFFL